MREIPFTIAKGFVMGAADAVPGVSGGTVALVFGIYHRLIDAIRNGSRAIGHALKGDVKGAVERLRTVEWLFLIPLLTGIVAAVFTLAGAIEYLLEEHPVSTAGAFMGLVGGSVVVAWQLLEVRDGRATQSCSEPPQPRSFCWASRNRRTTPPGARRATWVCWCSSARVRSPSAP